MTSPTASGLRGARQLINRRAWLVWLLLLGFTAPAVASHIVGGQLRLLRTAPYTYQVGLTMYFDALTGQPGARDPTVTVSFYERGTNRLMDTLHLTLRTTVPVNYGVVACQDRSISTDELRYSHTIRLDPNRYNRPGGYYVAWERCCRNVSIANITSPEGAGTAFYLRFPAIQQNGREFINSSPQGFLPTNGYACVAQPYRAAFGGTDPDGDSLAYDLVTPLNGGSSQAPTNRAPNPPGPAPYAPVRWLPGYDSLQQISGAQLATGQPLRVDARSGQISFTADRLGLFVFAVRCSEYRNRVKIGEVRREFQQLIVNCPVVTTPRIALTQNGPPGVALPYVPGTIVQLPADPTNRCMNLYLTSPDTTARVSLELIPLDTGTVAGVSLAPTGGTVVSSRDTLRARICFPDGCFGTDGLPHAFRLIVRKDACPQAVSDSLDFRVQAPLVPDAPPRLRVWPRGPRLAFDTTVVAGATIVRRLIIGREGDSLSVLVRGYDTDPDTRITVRCLNLGTGQLTGLPVVCPTVTTDADSATTRLEWLLGCEVPPGLYRLRFGIASENCGRVLTRQDSVQVQVLPTEKVVTLPYNIFTPNGDNLNDTFAPAAGLEPACKQTFRRLRIFNRWGREVFASADRLAAWAGGDAAGGIYYYVLEYSDRSYKGWVELIR